MFKPEDPKTIEAARRGGRVRQAQRRGVHPPFTETFLHILDLVGMMGPTWFAGRVFWKAVFALEMTPEELEVYRRHTERENPPTVPFREVWLAIGRRGGKSRNAALAALFLGITFDVSRLAPGEVATIPVICPDRKQARQVLGYPRGFLALPDLKPFLNRELRESIELKTGVNIEVHTASYRTVRGHTFLGAVLDEIAFWRTDENTAEPDKEVLSALRPGMATVEFPLQLGLSSPYAYRGVLPEAHERYFGQEDPHVLVWNADSRSMNPSLPPEVVERAFEQDPIAAVAEFGREGRVEFRRDVEAFLDPDVLRAVTVPGRRELPPVEGVSYRSFSDPSGGSADSFTLAIAHQEEGGLVVLDAIRKRRPRFSPDAVVTEFSELLKAYRVR